MHIAPKVSRIPSIAPNGCYHIWFVISFKCVLFVHLFAIQLFLLVFCQSPMDKSPMGQSPIGNFPIGKSPMGKSPTGKFPIGKSPTGEFPIGKSPIGQFPIGKSPIGELPLGQFPIGKFPIGKSQMKIQTKTNRNTKGIQTNIN